MIWDFVLRLWDRWRPGRWPNVEWVDPAVNGWSVPVLDVRPVTHSLMGFSTNQEYAENSISFGREDGSNFVDLSPEVNRTIPSVLVYRTDGRLYDGVLFTPMDMDQKWALFFRRNKILCVRSWTRTVSLVAGVEQGDGELRVKSLNGVVTSPDESNDRTEALFDYLMLSHALRLSHPVPLPAGIDRRPRNAAMWCFSHFGNVAAFATSHALPISRSDKPLRTVSRLHIAAAQGNRIVIESCLDEGVPVDLGEQEGHSALHWSFQQEDLGIAELLVTRGASIDKKADNLATPLMWAAGAGNMKGLEFLVDLGAEVNAASNEGATALHHAVNAGEIDVVRALLQWGCVPVPMADGATPLAIAEAQGHSEIASLLS